MQATLPARIPCFAAPKVPHVPSSTARRVATKRAMVRPVVTCAVTWGTSVLAPGPMRSASGLLWGPFLPWPRLLPSPSLILTLTRPRFRHGLSMFPGRISPPLLRRQAAKQIPTL